jgi:hypothetical protein
MLNPLGGNTGFVDFVHRPEFSKARKHSLSETWSVSFFKWAEGDTQSVGTLRKSWPQSLDLDSLRLVHRTRSNSVVVSFPSPEDENRSSFRYVVFYRYLALQRMGKVQKPSDFQCFTPSEPFRFYLLVFGAFSCPLCKHTAKDLLREICKI